MNKTTLIQYFEWYLANDGSLWKQVAQEAKKIADLGIDKIWLPPAYKGASGKNDVGYGVYDMYDLGSSIKKEPFQQNMEPKMNISKPLMHVIKPVLR